MKLKAMELLSSASMHNVLKAVKLLSHLAAHPAGLVAEGTGAGPPDGSLQLVVKGLCRHRCFFSSGVSFAWLEGVATWWALKMQRGPLQANKGGNCTVFNETTDSKKLHLTSVVYEEHLACDSDQQTQQPSCKAKLWKHKVVSRTQLLTEMFTRNEANCNNEICAQTSCMTIHF